MNNKLLVLGLDAAVLVSLMGVLVAVVGLDALLTYRTPPTEAQTQPQITQPPITKKTITKRTLIAVTRPWTDNLGVWDDVGTLLKSLGDGYRFTDLNEVDLYDLDKLKTFDVVFCSCSAVKADAVVAKNLNAYVAQGGTLYASDWRYHLVAQAFPDIADLSQEADGLDEFVDAEVVDPGLRDILGKHVNLRFELNKWRPAAFKGDRVKVLLRGSFTDMRTNQRHTAPLLVKFSFGKGNVIFTSYHHGKTHSETEKKLLKYLVYSLVTARIETEIETTQLQGQFSPAKSNLFSATKEDPKVTYIYQNPKAGKLRFDLGFAEGAELKLTVKSPGGKVTEKQGTSSFYIEIANAEAGNWTYTVTALSVPHENFAFVASVANGKTK
jgi:hypothetical protein